MPPGRAAGAAPPGTSSVLIRKVRPHFFVMPGKNSASFDIAGLSVGSGCTSRSPMWFCAISATVSGRRILRAVQRAAVQHHAQEGQVVGRRWRTARRRREEFAVRRWRCRVDRLQRSVRLPRVHLHGPRGPLRTRIETGVAHAQRREDMLAHIGFQVLAADRLDHAAGPVDVDAVFPALARFERQRRVQRFQLAGARRRQAGRLDVARLVARSTCRRRNRPCASAAGAA